MRAAQLIIAFLLGCGLNAAAQKNLVRNGDFERYDSCPPNRTEQIAFANFWSAIDSTGLRGCAPEYMNACAPMYSGAHVPENYFGFQYAHSGNGMAHALMFSDESEPNYPDYLRDYLQGRLYKKLTAGKSYCISFFVNLTEWSKYAVKEISAYLDNGSIDTIGKCGWPQMRYTPQVTNTGGILADTANWLKIEGSFIATGAESFITIGNYKDKLNATYAPLPRNPYNAGKWFSTYFIDDVSVVETGTPADAGPDKLVGAGDSVYIGLPSSEVIWNSWRVLGDTTVIGEGPGIWVKPKVTTSYVVTQTLCGTTTKDTVEVEVRAAGLQSIKGQSQQYNLFPNPNNGSFEITQSVMRNESLQADVVNVMGQKVLSVSLQLKNGKAVFDKGRGLAPGIYYLALKDHQGYVWNLRFVKQ